MSISHVYFIRNTASGFIKIGKADDPEQRLRTLQTANAAALELLQVVEVHSNPYEVEASLHKRFAHLQITEGGGTEWFRPGEDLVAFIASLDVQEDPSPARDWRRIGRWVGAFVAAVAVGLVVVAVARWILSHWIALAFVGLFAAGAAFVVPAVLGDRARQLEWAKQREDKLRRILGEST